MIGDSPFSLAQLADDRLRQEFAEISKYGENYKEIITRRALFNLKAAACGAATAEELRYIDEDFKRLEKLVDDKFPKTSV